MTKTRIDLITRTLQVLGVLAAGQSMAAEDQQLVNDNLESVLEELAGDEIVYVPNMEEIEEAIFPSLAICVADRMAMDFGTAIDVNKVGIAEARLRRIGRNGPKYSQQVTSYI